MLLAKAHYLCIYCGYVENQITFYGQLMEKGNYFQRVHILFLPLYVNRIFWRKYLVIIQLRSNRFIQFNVPSQADLRAHYCKPIYSGRIQWKLCLCAMRVLILAHHLPSTTCLDLPLSSSSVTDVVCQDKTYAHSIYFNTYSTIYPESCHGWNKYMYNVKCM